MWRSRVVNTVGCGTQLAMTRGNGTTEIAVAGRELGFWFLWNTDGSPTWHSVQIDAPAVAWGPVMTRYDEGTEIATVEKS